MKLRKARKPYDRPLLNKGPKLSDVAAEPIPSEVR